MVLNGLSIDKGCIHKMMKSYLGLTMSQVLMYKQIECKNNKSLVQFIGRLMIKKVHEIIEISNSIAYILSFVLL